ncbi:MAG: MOSC domain-containing protein [Planctomycetes bacterium]|nr:MOSC domain-containing protein [Planctomycetota bacterium]
MTDLSNCSILAIAVRTAKEGPMREIDQAVVQQGGGIEGDLPAPHHRSITLLSASQWAQTTKQLEVELPWHTRRANVLLDSDSLEGLIGCTIQLGETKIQINAETTPCGLMDRLHPGLRKALAPGCRGGVYGEVIEGGVIKVGDALSVC